MVLRCHCYDHRVLARLDILGTAPTQPFERSVELVRQIFLQRAALL